MLYAGLDLSRQRLDVHVLDEEGRTVDVLAVHPDAGRTEDLASRVLRHGQEVSAAIESMTGSRFVHDTLERFGWDVMIADAVKAKGVAPLAARRTRSMLECWPSWPAATSFQRSGCPIRPSGRSASEPASGSIWSTTGAP